MSNEIKEKFTPPPWDFTKTTNLCGDFVCCIHQKEGAPYTEGYSDIGKTCVGEANETQIANAQLIASAPDMYRMLDDIEKMIINSKNEIELADSVVSISHDLNLLLAKARGEHIEQGDK